MTELYVIEYLADWSKSWKVYTCSTDKEEALERYARHLCLHPKEQCRMRAYVSVSDGDLFNFDPNIEEDK